MPIIFFFTCSLPNALSDELSRQGHTVHECLAISEVLALAQEHTEAQIVIAADVVSEAAKVIRQHYPTLCLKPESRISDLIWELSHTFFSCANKGAVELKK